MKTRFLFPARAKYIGIALLAIALALSIISNYVSNLPQGYEGIVVWHHFHEPGVHPLKVNGDECFDDEIVLSLVLVGLILIASSKEKVEDEHISTVRLESLQWAMYVNYGVFLYSFIPPIIYPFYFIRFTMC